MFLCDDCRAFPEGIDQLDDNALRDKLIGGVAANDWAQGGAPLQVFDLSEPGAEDTVELPDAIRNDLKNKSGRGYAFTQGQRYVSLAALKKDRTTSEL